jgi:hypothetical protein
MPEIFELEVDCEEDVSPRHFIQGSRLLVVSALFLDALKQVGVENFKVWPAVLREPKTERKWENYFVFNKIGLVDAVLHEASNDDVIMKGDGGSIPDMIAYHKVVFDTEKVKDEKMFRILQCPTLGLYISEEVFDVLCQLSPPEEWGITATEIEVK